MIWFSIECRYKKKGTRMKSKKLKLDLFLLIVTAVFLAWAIGMLIDDQRPLTIATTIESAVVFLAALFFYVYDMRKRK